MMRKALLRRKIREVLAMAATRRFTELMILDAVNQLIPEPASKGEIGDELQWNHESGYVDFKHNRDINLDEWFLTERGKQKAANE
jgi:hypothetical protein